VNVAVGVGEDVPVAVAAAGGVGVVDGVCVTDGLVVGVLEAVVAGADESGAVD